MKIPDLSIFSNLIRQGKDINIFEDGEEARDFVFIDDIAEATVRGVLLDEANGNIFNVGTGIGISVMDVARKLNDLYDGNSNITVSGQFRIGDIRNNYADIESMKKTLKFEPKTSFEEGIIKFADWVKTQEVYPDQYKKSLDEMKDKGLFK